MSAPAAGRYMVGSHALVIGGTRFIGRHTVAELLAHDYEVTLFNRGQSDNPFADDDRVDHVAGDRTDDADLLDAADVDPDVVIDSYAYFPRGVRTALRVFDDVDAYVYLSSGAAYETEDERIPKREDETPLHPCSSEQEVDESWDSYGPRKAEGDRAVFEAAAERGVRAMSVRPPIVYGPHDYTGRFDYWVERVTDYDRVLVPGDGSNLRHLVYVEDVASALRTVAEEGEAGEAYNVGDRHLPTIDEWVDRIADAAGTEVEVVHASERELSTAGLSLTDFPLYRPYPHVLSTSKLAALGWDATPHEEAIGATVDHVHEADRSGADDRDEAPSREEEERVLGILDTL